MKDEIKIPPFVQNYLDKLDGDGLSDFVKVSAEYQKEKQDYPGKYAEQAAHLNDHNRRTGQNRQLNYEDGLMGIDTRYRQRAYQTAKQHGYKGPDPTQPSDKEFTKQGEKFQGMIDHAKQRQQEKPEQPKQDQAQKQEAEPGNQKQDIDKLKEQQPYQQDSPKVEFKGMAQDQSSGTGQPSQDEQRAAFLEKVKQTRDQQTQRTTGQQPEI